MPDAPAAAGVEYHRVHELGRPGVWRPIVGVLLLGLLTFVVGPFLLTLPVVAWALAQGGDWQEHLRTALDTEHVSPFALGFLNVVLACGIGYAFLVTWWLHRLRPGWITSVLPRMRWRFFAIGLGLSVVALIATLIVGALLPAGSANDSTEISGELNAFTSTTRDFLLVVLFLTPFQAAGEEYVFRGYLTQAFGGIFHSRVVAVVVPAVLFALAHGAQSAPIFVDRLAFGLVAGALVILTGGLEAGIAMHVLNNFAAFGLALAYGDMSEALNPTGGSWWSLPATLTQSLLYLWLATAAARTMKLAATGEPPTQVISR